MEILEFIKILKLIDIFMNILRPALFFGIFAKFFAENVKLPRTKNLTSRPCQALCDLVRYFSTKNGPLWAGMAGKVPDAAAIPANVQACQIRT